MLKPVDRIADRKLIKDRFKPWISAGIIFEQALIVKAMMRDIAASATRNPHLAQYLPGFFQHKHRSLWPLPENFSRCKKTGCSGSGYYHIKLLTHFSYFNSCALSDFSQTVRP